MACKGKKKLPSYQKGGLVTKPVAAPNTVKAKPPRNRTAENEKAGREARMDSEMRGAARTAPTTKTTMGKR